jgi:hypothetical protein
LDSWFDELGAASGAGAAAAKRVHLCANGKPGRYDVLPSVDGAAMGLELGEALATFWERVSFLLVDDLRDAMVLHAAALRHRDAVVLIPGRSGSGKTRLSLWYRARGFGLGTDEIVSVSLAPDSGDLVLNTVPARPLIVKSSSDLRDMLRPGETARLEQDSPFGRLVKLVGGDVWSQQVFARGLIVFPRFSAGAPLALTAMTPGEACLDLLDSCLNVRNLPRGGLALAGALARKLPALSLRYGQTAQLDRTLDVLTRQVLAAQPSRDDLADLCEAFTARVTVRRPGQGAAARGTAELAAAPARAVPSATAAKFPRRLTIGMATYDDYDGVYFTIQSIRLGNPELAGAVEFVVIDNNPGGPCSQALAEMGNWIDGYRYLPRGEWSGTAIRNAVFEEASSRFVLCIDSHVLIAPGAIGRLIAYLEADPSCRDLLQGPMIYDDLRKLATHMEPHWRAGMYGIWGEDPRAAEPAGPAFEIPMHGLGLFACRRAVWPGFHPRFRGFGGEEGYIHEKVRRSGGRTLCLPFLRWMHRFGRPLGAAYPNRWEDRIRNYLIGFGELGIDTADMEAHFAQFLGAETSARIFREIRSRLQSAQ